MATNPVPVSPTHDTTVDLLVIGSGTGMAAALTAHELGLSTLIVEKTEYVGGSTARSGGAFWVPANPVLRKAGSGDTLDRAGTYIRSVVGESAPAERGAAFLDHAPPPSRCCSAPPPCGCSGPRAIPTTIRSCPAGPPSAARASAGPSTCPSSDPNASGCGRD